MFAGFQDMHPNQLCRPPVHRVDRNRARPHTKDRLHIRPVGMLGKAAQDEHISRRFFRQKLARLIDKGLHQLRRPPGSR